MSTRRKFLQQAGISAAALVMADSIIANPYKPLIETTPNGKTVKITGAVRAGGKGIANVPVSDGITVVTTNNDGAFELISFTFRPFVFVTIPSGYKIPQNKTGTSSFYLPIKPNADYEMTASFNLEPVDANDNKHNFLVLADPQTLDNDDMNWMHRDTVPDVRKTVKGMENVFGVACGDIMYDKLELFPEYEKAVSKMGVPFFQVLGNHDVEVATHTDEESIATFMDHFGPTYYSFNRGEVHYVVLDDIFWFGGYVGYLSKQQLDWLKQDLALVEKGKTVVVYVHIPANNTQHTRYGHESPRNSVVITNRELLFDLLQPYKSYVISGHTHESDYLTESGSELHVCGAVCGAWWTGPICHDGTPMGYSVYKVSGSELKWEYKSTGHDMSHQMRIYKRGANPELPDEIPANIWTADDKWKIVWYEDGIKIGNMRNVLSKDPLSVELHSGKELPQKHTWVEPLLNNHMFYARPSANAKEIIVEATDRWGRTYTDKIALG